MPPAGYTKGIKEKTTGSNEPVFVYHRVNLALLRGLRFRGFFLMMTTSTLSSVGRAVVLYTTGPWFESRRVDKRDS